MGVVVEKDWYRERKMENIIKKFYYFPLSTLILLGIFCLKKISKVKYGSKYFYYFWKMYFLLFNVVGWLIGFDLLEKNRRKTMSKIFGLKANEAHDFVIKEQLSDPPEDQVKWQVRFLTSKEYADIQNKLFKTTGFGDKREEQLLTGTQTLLILQRGLVGWTNFKYQDGKVVKWEDPNIERTEEGKNRVMQINLDKVPPYVRAQLAEYIRGESFLEKD